MKTSVGIGIFEQAVAFLTPLSALNLPLFALHLKIIGIDKVVAGVVRRIDVDHLDLAKIALLQKLEDFQIVALDVEVFGGVPVLALCHARAQRLLGFHDCSLLTHPCELVCLVAVHHVR